MRLGIAAESKRDAPAVTGLADRLLVDAIDWIENETIGAIREWCGIRGEAWLDVHEAFDRARDAGLRIYGTFSGEPGAIDAQMHRAIFLLFANEAHPPAAVVVARDIDGKPDRHTGFHQAIGERCWPFAVIGALANPEMEAWLVASWRPETPADGEAHAGVRDRIGFDPTASPERLTSRKQTDKKDAKRVLEELCASGRTALERWASAQIDERLLEAGADCGLTAYIEDVRTKLVPLLKGTA